MKKYLLGLFAVVLAVGFSSFSHIQTTLKKAPVAIWFDVNDAGSALDVINGSELESTFSCPTGDNQYCQKAFTYDAASPSTSQVEIVSGNYRLKSSTSIDAHIDERLKP